MAVDFTVDQKEIYRFTQLQQQAKKQMIQLFPLHLAMMFILIMEASA